jgi:hypothetical protein
MRLTVTCHGNDPLGLRELLERFAADQWLPAHATPEQATAIVLDQFQRTIAATMAMLGVEMMPEALNLANGTIIEWQRRWTS